MILLCLCHYHGYGRHVIFCGGKNQSFLNVKAAVAHIVSRSIWTVVNWNCDRLIITVHLGCYCTVIWTICGEYWNHVRYRPTWGKSKMCWSVLTLIESDRESKHVRYIYWPVKNFWMQSKFVQFWNNLINMFMLLISYKYWSIWNKYVGPSCYQSSWTMIFMINLKYL